MKKWIALVGLVLAGSWVRAEVAAFPGADGFGAGATGGRGGEVVHVTNLNDAGAGSLREAVSGGKRIVVFDVGGYVELKSILHVASDMTIAGQSAPGDGIGTRGHEVSFSSSRNVICRYMRFRQGLADREEKKAAVAMHDAHRIILDHVSIQWGRWDTVDMTGASEVTLQYCIIGPGVGPQRFGCLCQSDDVTFTHNLWISNQSRNPKSKGKVQFVNNVVYNWGKVGFVGGHSAREHFVDVVGNYFIKGPSSSNTFAGEFSDTDKLYQSGNMLAAGQSGKLEGRALEGTDFRGATVVGKPWSTLVAIDAAEEAYRKVAESAGCSLRRDSVDRRLTEDLMSLGRRGAVVSDPEEMGGFGRIDGGVTPKDSDGDGIPDEWEVAHGLDPHDAKDGMRVAGEGYAMIEVYLNSLVGK